MAHARQKFYIPIYVLHVKIRIVLNSIELTTKEGNGSLYSIELTHRLYGLRLYFAVHSYYNYEVSIFLAHSVSERESQARLPEAWFHTEAISRIS